MCILVTTHYTSFSGKTTKLGIILGAAGSGVTNDFHDSVFFFQLLGRKAWLFVQEPAIVPPTKNGKCKSDTNYDSQLACHKAEQQVTATHQWSGEGFCHPSILDSNSHYHRGGHVCVLQTGGVCVVL